MSKCEHCNKVMSRAKGCMCVPVVVKGITYVPIKYGSETMAKYEPERCHDCGCVKGRYHHTGCDVEECPVCHGQMLTCDCMDGK